MLSKRELSAVGRQKIKTLKGINVFTAKSKRDDIYPFSLYYCVSKGYLEK